VSSDAKERNRLLERRELAKAYEPGNIERKWYDFWLTQGYFTPQIDYRASHSPS
jgi:valyl-tRNA synthetase